jgi:hypothetical protein
MLQLQIDALSEENDFQVRCPDIMLGSDRILARHITGHEFDAIDGLAFFLRAPR